ncbi:MAG: phosphate signaling complex protein PhoU [candidate division WOR-3 bacterium]|jgi:phosphate transport system protein
MRKPLSDELIELENKVFEVSEIIKKMFLNCKNYEEILKLEDIVNQTEMDIELFGIKILALYQPEAGDLRKIITAIKVNNDLERIADHIENISRDYYLMKDNPVVSVQELFDKVMLAYEKAINSYKNRDVNLAKEVIMCDKEIDEMRNKLIVEIVNYIMENPSKAEISLKTLNIVQNLERIADLSTNICEDVIFLIEGKIYKHGKEI